MILFSKKIFQQAKTKSQIMIAGARLRWSGETAQVGQLGTWQPRIKFQSSKRFFVANFKACAKKCQNSGRRKFDFFCKKNVFLRKKNLTAAPVIRFFLQEWKIENKQTKKFLFSFFVPSWRNQIEDKEGEMRSRKKQLDYDVRWTPSRPKGSHPKNNLKFKTKI